MAGEPLGPHDSPAGSRGLQNPGGKRGLLRNSGEFSHAGAGHRGQTTCPWHQPIIPFPACPSKTALPKPVPSA